MSCVSVSGTSYINVRMIVYMECRVSMVGMRKFGSYVRRVCVGC
jgi:hypothetical protein